MKINKLLKLTLGATLLVPLSLVSRGTKDKGKESSKILATEQKFNKTEDVEKASFEGDLSISKHTIDRDKDQIKIELNNDRISRTESNSKHINGHKNNLSLTKAKDEDRKLTRPSFSNVIDNLDNIRTIKNSDINKGLANDRIAKILNDEEYEAIKKFQLKYPNTLTNNQLNKIVDEFSSDPKKLMNEIMNDFMPLLLENIYNNPKNLVSNYIKTLKSNHLNVRKNPVVEKDNQPLPKTMWRNSEHLNSNNFWIIDYIGIVVNDDLSEMTGRNNELFMYEKPSLPKKPIKWYAKYQSQAKETT